MPQLLPSKDPDDVEPYFIVWCDILGLNDGSPQDKGELQGATITLATWTVPQGITKDSESLEAVTIRSIDYPANTVTTIWLSGGTAKTSYDLTCFVEVSDGRKLTKTITVPIAEA